MNRNSGRSGCGESFDRCGGCCERGGFRVAGGRFAGPAEPFGFAPCSLGRDVSRALGPGMASRRVANAARAHPKEWGHQFLGVVSNRLEGARVLRKKSPKLARFLRIRQNSFSFLPGKRLDPAIPVVRMKASVRSHNSLRMCSISISDSPMKTVCELFRSSRRYRCFVGQNGKPEKIRIRPFDPCSRNLFPIGDLRRTPELSVVKLVVEPSLCGAGVV